MMMDCKWVCRRASLKMFLDEVTGWMVTHEYGDTGERRNFTGKRVDSVWGMENLHAFGSKDDRNKRG